MAVTSAAYPSTSTTTTNAAVFIPELWSDEIIATYKSNLVLANLVTRMNHKGKKGDVIRIPTPERGSAAAKAAATLVTLQVKTETDLTITINKHYEYSRMIDDIAEVQALSSMRAFYTDDAGYALAQQIDRSLFVLAPFFQAGTDANDTNIGSAVQANDGSTAFSIANYASLTACFLTDAAIRRMIQTLDDNDVPMSERAIVIPPVEKKNLTGLARFTEQAFVGEGGGGNTIRTGRIGNVYGVEVYVSSNCPWLLKDSSANEVIGTWSATDPGALTNYTDIFGRVVNWSGTQDSGSSDYRMGIMLHKSAMALGEQLGIRVQTQYKQEYLATLMTADTIYGVGELRDTSAIAFVSTSA